MSAEPPGLLVAWRPLDAAEAALDPLALFAAAPEEERFYLEQPARGTALAALGAVAEVAAGGERRFALAAEAARALAARTCVSGERPPQAPLLVGGFAFRPGEARPGSPWRRLGDLRFALPRLLWCREGERAWLAYAVRVEAGARVQERLAASAAEADALLARARRTAPAAEAAARPRLVRPLRGYRARVAAALDAIAKGELDKVVVARSLALDGVAAPVEDWLAALRRSQPACATYAVAPPGAALAFLGATPELLVRARGRVLAAQALAGTAPAGREAELLSSEKERAEHACVVEDVAAALAPICERLEHPAAPRALALGGLVHLETPLRAHLAEGSGLGLLDVAARLHPSPAVCGAPRAAASRWLAAHEGLERGWYAGGVGWLDAAGGGELFVALRCALLAGRRAELFAGAGIVAGSAPAAEQRETRMKLRALLRVAAEG